MWALYSIMTFFVLALVIPAGWALTRVYREARGRSQVTCPETDEPELVQLDRRYAVAMYALGNPNVRLQTCTRWPERQNCDQGCRQQIVIA